MWLLYLVHVLSSSEEVVHVRSFYYTFSSCKMISKLRMLSLIKIFPFSSPPDVKNKLEAFELNENSNSDISESNSFYEDFK